MKFVGRKMVLGHIYSQHFIFSLSVSFYLRYVALLRRIATLYKKDKRAKTWNPQGNALSIISKHWIGSPFTFFNIQIVNDLANRK